MNTTFYSEMNENEKVLNNFLLEPWCPLFGWYPENDMPDNVIILESIDLLIEARNLWGVSRLNYPVVNLKTDLVNHYPFLYEVSQYPWGKLEQARYIFRSEPEIMLKASKICTGGLLPSLVRKIPDAESIILMARVGYHVQEIISPSQVLALLAIAKLKNVIDYLTGQDKVWSEQDYYKARKAAYFLLLMAVKLNNDEEEEKFKDQYAKIKLESGLQIAKLEESAEFGERTRQAKKRGGENTHKETKKIKVFAIEFVSDWETMPHDDPDFKIGRMASMISQQIEKKFACHPPTEKTIRKWITPYAPKEAKRPGRPAR